MNPLCPLCRIAAAPWRPAREAAREIPLRERFVRRRFDHAPSAAEAMDLTRFQFGEPDDLLRCPRCGLVLRAATGDYAADTYDLDLLDHLYPRYRQAFAAREQHYRPLLPDRAEVIEVGSHLGAFLEVAEGWGWRPTGYDIGRDTRRFARRRGLRVLGERLEETRRAARTADAVFLWNCFEQLDDPLPVLRAAHGLLKRHGLLVLRTPNYGYYARWRRELGGPRHAEAVRRLAYNNLLGFPYRTGYTPATLAAVAAQHGYRAVEGWDSALLVTPYPELTPCAARQAEAVLAADSGGGASRALSGPWVETAFRAVD